MQLSVNATSNSIFLSATMLSVAVLLVPIFVTCTCSHVEDHSSQPHTPMIPVFFLTMPVFVNYGYFTPARHPGVVASLLGAALLCLRVLSASVESLAREIPSLFIREVVFQLINHTANAFCGSKVLVILSKKHS